MFERRKETSSEVGVCIFYKRDKFKAALQYGIDFNKAADIATDKEVQQRLMKNNVGLLVELHSIENESNYKFYVSTCHLHWNPAHADVKLHQSKYLVSVIKYHNIEKDLPLIIAGDFNSGTLYLNRGCNFYHSRTYFNSCFCHVKLPCNLYDIIVTTVHNVNIIVLIVLFISAWFKYILLFYRL